MILFRLLAELVAFRRSALNYYCCPAECCRTETAEFAGVVALNRLISTGGRPGSPALQCVVLKPKSWGSTEMCTASRLFP